jgi:hypothetical protein
MYLVALAVLLFGITSLVALVVLLARQTKAARLIFAGGLTCGTAIVALATLSFLQREFRGDLSASVLVLSALSLLTAGMGQLVAAFRGGRAYALAFAFAATSILTLAALLVLGTDVIGGLGQGAIGYGVPVAATSLLTALASVVSAFVRHGREVPN